MSIITKILNLLDDEDEPQSPTRKHKINVYQKALKSTVYIQNFNSDGKKLYGGGFVFNERYIVTANHVIDKTIGLTVEFANGKSYKAKYGPFKDEGRDLACLELEDSQVKMIPGELRLEPVWIGQKVAAVGHPFNQKWSYSFGVVSQLRDEVVNPRGNFVVKQAIQTDVALNPGNSGGPVFDMKGRVIGIANMILAPDGDYSGVGYLTGIGEIKKFMSGH